MPPARPARRSRGRWALPLVLLALPASAFFGLARPAFPADGAVAARAYAAPVQVSPEHAADWFGQVMGSALPDKAAPKASGTKPVRTRPAKRASRTRAPAAPSTGCASASARGYANGRIPQAALCPLWQAPGHLLRADAATALNALSAYHAAVRGRPLCLTDSYRSYRSQIELYNRKRGLAARPGTSEHGWGLAADLCGGIEVSGSAAHRWLEANAGRFGFLHPAWAEPGGSKPEPWHWEFSG